MRMAEVFARNGYRIEMLEEADRKSAPDVLINGIKGDLKSTSSPNNIVKYAKKAIKEQGAGVVLFEFEEETDLIFRELHKLKDRGWEYKYYFKGRSRVFEE